MSAWKSHSLTLAIKEMQIKIIIRYHYTSIRMAKRKMWQHQMPVR